MENNQTRKVEDTQIEFLTKIIIEMNSNIGSLQTDIKYIVKNSDEMKSEIKANHTYVCTELDKKVDNEQYEKDKTDTKEENNTKFGQKTTKWAIAISLLSLALSTLFSFFGLHLPITK